MEKSDSKRLFFTLSSMLILILILAVLIASLLLKNTLYADIQMYRIFVPNDIANMIIGVPVLLVSVAVFWRGRMIGAAMLPGALFYFVYTYFNYLFILPVSVMFFPHLIITAGSLYTAIGILYFWRERANDNLPKNHRLNQAAGVICILLALIIIIRQGVLASEAINEKNITSIEDKTLWINDFLFAVPPLLIAGILLFLKKPLGFVTGPAVLLMYGTLSLSLIPLIIYQAGFDQVPLDPAALFIIGMMALLCFVPFTLFTVRYKKLPAAPLTGNS